VLVLQRELHHLLPLDMIEPVPDVHLFPGETRDVAMVDTELEVRLVDDAWESTGLWLPAGALGTIEHGEEGLNWSAQIGSHGECEMGDERPWKRWPTVISIFDLATPMTDVRTPFGGILYIAQDVESERWEAVTFIFRGFCRCPRWVAGRPEIWDETRDAGVPWGEIDLGDVVFTLPAEEIRKVTDFDILKATYDKIVVCVSSFMSSQVDRSHRIVFDVEQISDPPLLGYPLMLSVDDIPQVIHGLDKPTLQLYNVIKTMCIVSMREECFDMTTEKAIAAVAAASAFKELYPEFNPFTFPELELPTLFKELWEIHTQCGATIIPETLSRYQNPHNPVLGVPEDMWIAFVRDMCRIGKKNFTTLLERSRPIPLNISVSLAGLPVYTDA